MNRSRDFLVGLVFFGLLFVLGAFTIFLADFRFGKAETLDVSFKRVDGLAVGANVWINGVQSGRVEKIERDPASGRVIVGLKFDGDSKLREGAEFRVDSLSLLGGKVVSISNGPVGSEALDSSKIRAGAVQGDPLTEVKNAAARLEKILADNEAGLKSFTDSLGTRGPELLDDLAAVADRLERGEGTLGMLLADDALGAKLVTAADRIAAAADRLERGEGTLGMLLTDDTIGKDLTAAAGRIAAAAERLEAGEGTLGKLLTDDALANDLTAAAKDIRAFTASLNDGRGTLGRLVNDPGLYDEARATLASLRSATAQIDAALGKDSQNNVIGLLLTDPKLADDLKRSVKAMSDFLESQRENAPLTTFAGLLFQPF